MPLDKQLFPIQIGGGIDTKTDSKKVISSKLLTLENGIFTEPGKLIKRNGYENLGLTIVGGTSLSAPKMVHGYNNELLCADSGKLYSYSEAISAWVDKGKYVSAALEKTLVSAISSDSVNFPQIAPNIVKLDNLLLFTWGSAKYASGAYTQGTFASVYDLSTGTFLLSNFDVSGSANTSIVPGRGIPIVLGGTTLAVVYPRVPTTTDRNICMKILTVNSTTVSFGSEIVLGTDYAGTSGVTGFDAVATSTGGVISYGFGATLASTGIQTKTVNTAGVVQNTATISGLASNSTRAISVTVDPTNANIWLYYYLNSTTTLTYAIYSSSLAVVLASTVINAATDPVYGTTSKVLSTTSQRLYYTEQASSGSFQSIKTVDITSAGVVGSITTVARNLQLTTKVFTVGSKDYVGTTFNSLNANQLQNTFFLIDLADGAVVGKALPGIAEARQARGQGNLSNVVIIDSNKVGMATAEQLTVAPIATGSTDKPQNTVYLTFDFDHQDLYQAINCHENVVLNGSILWLYDSALVTELGFNYFPYSIGVGQTTGGNMADGTYQYRYLYRWTDQNGNIHESSPSVAASQVVSAGGGTAAVSVTLYTLTLTQKTDVKLLVYRTTAGGSTFYLVNTADFINNDKTVQTLTYLDTNSDANITSNEQLYTNGNVIENIAPPAALLMTPYNNRLWIVPSETPTQVWYTKTFVTGTGISFSDLLTAEVDTREGPITAIAGMDDKLVTFKARVPFYFAGDGANDIGNNSTLSNSILVASDTGVSSQKSVVLMPQGLIAKTDKGWYLFNRNLVAQYLGTDVEDYNSQDVTGATLIKDKNQIRFLTSSGSTLLYDYLANQWSTFTNHEGVSATLWRGTYVYARPTALYKERSANYLDNATAISMKIGTAWLKLSDLQNFQRLIQLLILGEYKSAHTLNGLAYFDYDDSTSYSFTLTADATPPYQWRYFSQIQKCQAVRFVIWDTASGGTGEGYTLSQLGVEAALKKGPWKLPASRSVGS